MIKILGGILNAEVQEYLSYTAVLAKLILTHSEKFNEKRKEEVRDILKIYLVWLRNIFCLFVSIYAFEQGGGKQKKKKASRTFL